MARKGQGARALHLAFLSSGVGGVFGVLLLIFLTPLLAKWALAFGPSHLFWLAILGVTVIGSLDSRSFVKGLLSGCLGLWLSMIGYDDIQGVPRFVFHSSLTGGINIIAALIGLFAIPQVIDMFAKGRTRRKLVALSVEHQKISDSCGEIMRNPRALTIGAIVGAVIGLIPGVGGQIAGLVGYDQTRKFSPHKAKFGTGHPEGVIAAETANNAMVGPSLVPLLTLSIPGSPTAAVLLGGLLIHGIFPGADLFVRHPDVAWTFIDSMLVGRILMVIFGIFTAKWAAKIAKAPMPIMAAAVLVLAVFGSYSVTQSMGDVYVMFTLGVSMYILDKFGFSAAPLVLGLIRADRGSELHSRPHDCHRPRRCVGIFLHRSAQHCPDLPGRRIGRIQLLVRHAPGRARRQVRQPGCGGCRMNSVRIQHLVPATIILVLGIWVAWISFTQEPSGAFLFPRLISVIMVLLAVWNFSRAALGFAKAGAGFYAYEIRNILPGLVVAAIYVFFAAKMLGFYVASIATFLIIYSHV